MSAPEKTIESVSALIDRFALTAVGEDTFVGWYKSLPVALTLPCSHGSIGESGFEVPPSINILAQLRYVGVPEEAVPKTDDIRDPIVQAHIDEKRVRISFDDTIVHLTAFEADENFLNDGLTRCLDAMLDVVKRAGGSGNGNTCHYCKTSSIKTLTWIEDRVAQVCDECLHEKIAESAREKRASLPGVLMTLLCGAVAIIAGAAMWCGLWWLDFILIDWLTPKHQTEILVPDFVIIGELGVIGIAVGIVISLIIDKARKAGRTFPVVVAFFAIISAVMLGEAGVIHWILDDGSNSPSYWRTVRLIPQFWSSLEGTSRYRVAAIAIAVMTSAIIVHIRKTETN